MDLFGGQCPWNSSDWVASDDRVRGGKSQSYLETSSSTDVARFCGNLDIKTLGGAGFASQRTTGDDRRWDLSGYDGVELDIVEADEKQYTLILKDTVLPPMEDGREQSTISYEYDFRIQEGKPEKIFVPWTSFKATYRGREKKDAQSLNTKEVKRMSFMMRSFFGSQEGPFSLSIKSLSAVTKEHGEHEDLDSKEVNEDGSQTTPTYATENEGGFPRWRCNQCIVS